MSQLESGRLPDQGKPKGNYTGERLKQLRPETYRRVVQLLAEPREHVSIREICRQCHVTDDTVKAIELREAVPIAARKQALMLQAARIAKLAADRVEDQIDTAPLPQAVVTFGVMTDKIALLSNETSQLQLTHTIEPSQRLWERLNDLAATITRQAKEAKEAKENDSTSVHAHPDGLLAITDKPRQPETSAPIIGLNARK